MPAGRPAKDVLRWRTARADAERDRTPPSFWRKTVALQGTLDTFALPDVLRLLAMTRKTGRLALAGDRGSGSIWFDAGLVVDAEIAGASRRDLTESTFELLRYGTGTFSFDSDSTADSPGAGVPVDEVLSAAEAMVEEWRGIEAVVPSMDAWVALRPELPADEITISRTTWSTLATVGSGTTARRLAAVVGAGDLAACRAVVELIELGVAEVTVSPELPEGVPGGEDDDEEDDEASEVAEGPADPAVGTAEVEWPLVGGDDLIRFAAPPVNDDDVVDGDASADDPAPEALAWTQATETPVADALARWFGEQPPALGGTDGTEPGSLPNVLDGAGDPELVGAAEAEEAFAPESLAAADEASAWGPAETSSEGEDLAAVTDVGWAPTAGGADDVFAGWVTDEEVPAEGSFAEDPIGSGDRNALLEFLSSLKH
jgi:hypothetical protein